MRILFLVFTAALFCTACNPLGNDGPANDSASAIKPVTAIDEVRPDPKTTPIASYEKPVLNDLNKWFFRVQLYETKERFVYRLTMQYEEMREEKEIRFPNLKMEPQPQIKKGEKNFDAIVGFLDNKGAFKEFLKVSAEGGTLQLKTLKQYAVYSK